MITAVEQGRKLIITVGDGGDDSIVITVPPVNSTIGAQLFARWVNVTFGQTEHPEIDAEWFSRQAIGEDNWDTIEELRSAEANVVINAAFFWQTQGGGIDVVNELLGDGFPKAQQTVLTTNGLWEAFSQLQILLSGGSENLTPLPDGTPPTNTPTGTSDSSVSTLDRLPPSKKSINQNVPSQRAPSGVTSSPIGTTS